jgi:hypothetical protein
VLGVVYMAKWSQKKCLPSAESGPMP